jgi:hypothetical protein
LIGEKTKGAATAPTVAHRNTIAIRNSARPTAGGRGAAGSLGEDVTRRWYLQRTVRPYSPNPHDLPAPARSISARRFEQWPRETRVGRCPEAGVCPRGLCPSNSRRSPTPFATN